MHGLMREGRLSGLLSTLPFLQVTGLQFVTKVSRAADLFVLTVCPVIHYKICKETEWGFMATFFRVNRNWCGKMTLFFAIF